MVFTFQVSQTVPTPPSDSQVDRYTDCSTYAYAMIQSGGYSGTHYGAQQISYSHQYLTGFGVLIRRDPTVNAPLYIGLCKGSLPSDPTQPSTWYDYGTLTQSQIPQPDTEYWVWVDLNGYIDITPGGGGPYYIILYSTCTEGTGWLWAVCENIPSGFVGEHHYTPSGGWVQENYTAKYFSWTSICGYFPNIWEAFVTDTNNNTITSADSGITIRLHTTISQGDEPEGCSHYELKWYTNALQQTGYLTTKTGTTYAYPEEDVYTTITVPTQPGSYPNFGCIETYTQTILTTPFTITQENGGNGGCNCSLYNQEIDCNSAKNEQGIQCCWWYSKYFWEEPKCYPMEQTIEQMILDYLPFIIMGVGGIIIVAILTSGQKQPMYLPQYPPPYYPQE